MIGMICFAKPGLTEDLYIVQKQENLNNVLNVQYILLKKTRHIHKRQPILSSERMLHKDYDHKGSVEKKSGRDP
jgi:hypothetical protein